MRLVERRPPVAHLVALGRLDLDDLGAMVAQDLGAIRPAQHPGEVEHEDPVERACGHGRGQPGLDRRIGQVALGEHIVGRVRAIDRKAAERQAGLVDRVLDRVRSRPRASALAGAGGGSGSV